MVLTVQTYPLLMVQKLTPPYWEVPLARGNFLSQEEGVSLHCHYHSWDFLPCFPKLSKKWSKVSSEQHFKMLDICGLSAFFEDEAAGVTLGAF